jgi:uncharacterized protein with gpF-like domain
MTRQQQFASKVRELIAQSHALPQAASRNVMELLDETRKRIAGELAGVDPQSYTAAQLKLLKQSIDQAFEQFRVRAIALSHVSVDRAAQLGTDVASAPLSELGLHLAAYGRVNIRAIAIAEGYSADLITNLSALARAKVNAAITRAFLGGQTQAEIMQQIFGALGGQGQMSVFDSIGARAQDVFTNEIMRVQSMATQSRLEDMRDNHPELKKAWRHTSAARIPRRSHMLADGQVVAIDQPFLVKPRLGADAEELMFPRDPAGSAENTINCHCLEVPHLDQDALQATPGQRGILEGLGLSISVTPAA